MQTRKLGSTGIEVSRLGIGLSEIRESDVHTVEKLLNTALDQGINFLDTSACYGNSEELVGKTVANRRNEFSLATKCGHITGDFDGIAWTGSLLNIYDMTPSIKNQIDLAKNLFQKKNKIFGSCCVLHVLVTAAGGKIRKYPRGLEDRNTFMNKLSIEKIKENISSRNVTLLLGEEDITN